MVNVLSAGENSIYKNGYGIVAKFVMRDKNLSVEAKAIYAYICSFAGSGTTAFPSAELMISELKMGKNRFFKFRKELVDKGYITIVKQRAGNRRERNLYKIESDIIKKMKIFKMKILNLKIFKMKTVIITVLIITVLIITVLILTTTTRILN